MNQFFRRRDFWILAVALALLGFGVSFRRARHQVEPATLSSPEKASLSSHNHESVPHTLTKVDTNQLAELSARWLNAGGPDPFGHSPPAPKSLPGPDPFAGFAQLQLTAVWRQPARQIAVINRQVVTVGETIGNFRLEHCEVDAVWLAVSNAARRLKMPRLSEAVAHPISKSKSAPPSAP